MEIKAFNTPQTNFKAMKSSQFKSLEYSAMRRFKAPIEKFNSIQNFYDWSARKCVEIAQTDFGGRDASTQLKRKVMKTDWLQYLSGLSNITTPVVLLVMYSMLKGLKDNNSDLLPQLDEGVFQKTLESTKAKLDANRDYQFDFRKLYVEKLRQKLMCGSDSWVVIPSKLNDEANYQANLEKLKALSPRTWCTKNDKADDYLKNCDIHIFYQKGYPELGVRVKDGRVYDIVGFENNGKIPQKYLSTIIDYVNENSLELGFEAQDQIESALYLQNTISSIRKEIGSAIEENDVYKIMEYFGFKPEYLDDGSISIAGYMQPRQGNFSDLGVDENRLFEKISEIRGNASFRNCAASSLVNIKKIGGMANFSESAILDTGALEEVGRGLYFADSNIKSVPNLKKVGDIITYKNVELTLQELKERF